MTTKIIGTSRWGLRVACRLKSSVWLLLTVMSTALCPPSQPRACVRMTPWGQCERLLAGRHKSPEGLWDILERNRSGIPMHGYEQWKLYSLADKTQLSFTDGSEKVNSQPNLSLLLTSDGTNPHSICLFYSPERLFSRGPNQGGIHSWLISSP